MPAVLARPVQVGLLEEAAESGHQALLDSTQGLTLVLVPGPPSFAGHLLIGSFGAAHWGGGVPGSKGTKASAAGIVG